MTPYGLQVLVPPWSDFDETSEEDLTNALQERRDHTRSISVPVSFTSSAVADIDLAFKYVTTMVTEDSPSKTQLEQLCRYVLKQCFTKKQPRAVAVVGTRQYVHQLRTSIASYSLDRPEQHYLSRNSHIIPFIY